MDRQGRDLAETVWTRLDRKAGAITELTIRQLRHRMSTWVVLGVGTLLILMLLAFYVDSVRDGFKPIDNDGDSADNDEDGYPFGQERRYGTSDWNPREYPGSGYYVQDGEISWNDDARVHSGNHTWRGATGIFTPVWLDSSYEGDRWSGIIDYESIENCPDEGDFATDWWIEWGTACWEENGDLVVQSLEFRGEGRLEVTEDWGAEWGHITDVYDVEPQPASDFIDEDDIDWDGNILRESQGYDDDGDCRRVGWLSEDFWFEKDTNRNNIDCDVRWVLGSDGETIIFIQADEYVDEDPDDVRLAGEGIHRGFIIGTAKIAFIMILSIFLPLFLALGLVRDETENGTLHYLLSKPIHRGEFITYRLLGYVIVAGGFVMALAMIMALVTSLMGPGDSLIRLRDIAMWMGIGFATVLALTAYGAIFNTLGLVSSKYGVYIALIVGVYEFIMAVLTLFGASLVPVLSVSHWTLQLVDSLVLIIWPDTLMMELQANAFGLSTGIDLFWNPPVHSLGTDNPFISAIISVVVLIFITVFMIWFGQRQFSRSEIM